MMGICLTQVTPICRMPISGRVPAELDGTGGRILEGRGLPGLAGSASLAGRVPVPALRRGQVMAGTRDVIGVCGLPMPDIGDGGDDFSGHADAFGALVPGDVVGDDSEERGKCTGPAAGAGPEELRDGVDVAA